MVRKNPNRDEWKMPMELGQERFILCLKDGLFDLIRILIEEVSFNQLSF
jgi:hypothetical protein